MSDEEADLPLDAVAVDEHDDADVWRVVAKHRNVPSRSFDARRAGASPPKSKSLPACMNEGSLSSPVCISRDGVCLREVVARLRGSTRRTDRLHPATGFEWPRPRSSQSTSA